MADVAIEAASNPTATVLTDLYTVPASKSATISTFTACNQGNSTGLIRFARAPGGAADAKAHYIYYDIPVAPSETLTYECGKTAKQTTIFRVQASTGDFSFNLSGVEW